MVWALTVVNRRLIYFLVLFHTSFSIVSADSFFPEGQSPDGTLYKTDYECEGSHLKLTCPSAGSKIEIIRAIYGRFSIAICNERGETQWSVNCFAHATTQILQNSCNDLSTCSINVTSTSFGADPCPGTRKYVEVHYACVSPMTSSSSLSGDSSNSIVSADHPEEVIDSKRNGDSSFSSYYSDQTPPVWLTDSNAAKLWLVDDEISKSSTSTSSSSLAEEGESQDEKTNDQKKKRRPILVHVSTTTPSLTTTGNVTENLVEALDTNQDPTHCSPATSRGVFWNITVHDQIAIAACPEGSSGLAKRKCISKNEWQKEADMSDCKTEELVRLVDTEVSHLKEVIEISQAMLQDLSDDDSEHYSGDLFSVRSIIKLINNQILYNSQKFVNFLSATQLKLVLKNVVKSIGTTFSDKSFWQDLETDKQSLMRNVFLAMKVLRSLVNTIIKIEEFNLNLQIEDALDFYLTLMLRNEENELIIEQILTDDTHNRGNDFYTHRSSLVKQWRSLNVEVALKKSDMVASTPSSSFFIMLNFISLPLLKEELQPIIYASSSSTRNLNSPFTLEIKFLNDGRTEDFSHKSCAYWNSLTNDWELESVCKRAAAHNSSRDRTCLCSEFGMFSIVDSNYEMFSNLSFPLLQHQESRAVLVSSSQNDNEEIDYFNGNDAKFFERENTFHRKNRDSRSQSEFQQGSSRTGENGEEGIVPLVVTCVVGSILLVVATLLIGIQMHKYVKFNRKSTSTIPGNVQCCPQPNDSKSTSKIQQVLSHLFSGGSSEVSTIKVVSNSSINNCQIDDCTSQSLTNATNMVFPTYPEPVAYNLGSICSNPAYQASPMHFHEQQRNNWVNCASLTKPNMVTTLDQRHHLIPDHLRQTTTTKNRKSICNNQSELPIIQQNEIQQETTTHPSYFYNNHVIMSRQPLQPPVLSTYVENSVSTLASPLLDPSVSSNSHDKECKLNYDVELTNTSGVSDTTTNSSAYSSMLSSQNSPLLFCRNQPSRISSHFPHVNMVYAEPQQQMLPQNNNFYDNSSQQHIYNEIISSSSNNEQFSLFSVPVSRKFNKYERGGGTVVSQNIRTVSTQNTPVRRTSVAAVPHYGNQQRTNRRGCHEDIIGARREELLEKIRKARGGGFGGNNGIHF